MNLQFDVGCNPKIADARTSGSDFSRDAVVKSSRLKSLLQISHARAHTWHRLLGQPTRGLAA